MEQRKAGVRSKGHCRLEESDLVVDDIVSGESILGSGTDHKRTPVHHSSMAPAVKGISTSRRAASKSSTKSRSVTSNPGRSSPRSPKGQRSGVIRSKLHRPPASEITLTKGSSHVSRDSILSGKCAPRLEPHVLPVSPVVLEMVAKESEEMEELSPSQKWAEAKARYSHYLKSAVPSVLSSSSPDFPRSLISVADHIKERSSECLDDGNFSGISAGASKLSGFFPAIEAGRTKEERFQSLFGSSDVRPSPELKVDGAANGPHYLSKSSNGNKQNESDSQKKMEDTNTSTQGDIPRFTDISRDKELQSTRMEKKSTQFQSKLMEKNNSAQLTATEPNEKWNFIPMDLSTATALKRLCLGTGLESFHENWTRQGLNFVAQPPQKDHHCEQLDNHLVVSLTRARLSSEKEPEETADISEQSSSRSDLRYESEIPGVSQNVSASVYDLAEESNKSASPASPLPIHTFLEDRHRPASELSKPEHKLDTAENLNLGHSHSQLALLTASSSDETTFPDEVTLTLPAGCEGGQPGDDDEFLQELDSFKAESASQMNAEGNLHDSVTPTAANFTPQKIRSPTPSVAHILSQKQQGPGGLLAAVQAVFIKHLLYVPSVSQVNCDATALTSVQKLAVTEERRRACLVEAIVEILWRAGKCEKATLVWLTNKVQFQRDHPDYKKDDFTEKLLLYSFGNLEDLRTFLTLHISKFEEDRHGGVILLLYSLILSRGIHKIHEDFSTGETGVLLGPYGYYCTQTLVNLLLTGRASTYVCNDDIVETTPEGTVRKLKGVKGRSDIGLLSLDKELDQVGSFYKTPRYPVWLLRSGHQYALVFCLRADLISDWRRERWFQLHFVHALRRHSEPIIITVDSTVPRDDPKDNEEEEEEEAPIAERLLRMKWPESTILWSSGDAVDF